MTTRLHRTMLVVLAVAATLLLGSALGSLYELGRAHAQGTVAVVDAGVTTPTTGSAAVVTPASPADKLHDPIAEPQQAFDDAVAMKKIGWPLLLIGALLMIARGMQSAGKRWPSVRWIAWLNTGPRAFAIAGLITVGSAAFNTLVGGGTWFAVATAAMAAGLAMMVPAPAPPKPAGA
jgi:hypothetical protein